MILKKSYQMAKTRINSRIWEMIGYVSDSYLKYVVNHVSLPRHYKAESDNNRKVALWIINELDAMGYRVALQGPFDNIVAAHPKVTAKPSIVVGTHYDSVPGCPGADDNASGIATALTCAKILARHQPQTPVIYTIFNREEDHLMGSKAYVNGLSQADIKHIMEVHILEMVGYCSNQKGSQRLPPGLPIKTPEFGDFLGIIANQHSNHLITPILKDARTYLDPFPVLGLKVFLGMEKIAYHLRRSDHASFWDARISALMWTDTSEFRNRHYHLESDIPSTLDFKFMKKVAQLLLIRLLTRI